MSAPRFARGSKSRIFLYVGTVFAFGVAVCIIHETQVQLNDSRKAAEKCQQQQESLAAQLQVIYEYKTRLEKSLQEEKALHRKTRQELESQIDNEKQVREKDGIESVNKFTSLQQQYKILQGQHEDLTEDCNKVRQAQVVAAGERSRLESEVAAARQELEQVQGMREKEVEALKTQYLEVVTENDRLRKQNSDVELQAQRFAAELNYLRKQNIQLQKELGDAQNELASCKRKSGDIASGIVNKRDVEVAVVMPAPSSKKLVSSSPSVPAAAPKAEEDVGKNVLPQPGVLAHQVSSSTTHGSLVLQSATPKGKLAADRGQSNNVIPVPPPQGAQLGGASEVHSEGAERDDARHGEAQAPVDGVGARPPDSPHRQQLNKEAVHEDELKVKELENPLEIADGVGAAPDLMKHNDEHQVDNKEHAYQSHGAGMQWGLAPPAVYEPHQQAVVPLPYAYESHLHQVPHKSYNADILQNSILHRDASHQRTYHQDLPKLQPPIALPRSQHDSNAILQHPLPLPNRKANVGGYGMKEVEHHQPVLEEGERAEEEANVVRRWHIREPQRPLGGVFPYHGGGGGVAAGDYGREDEAEEAEVGEGHKVRGGRGQWGGGEHKEAPANVQEDLQLEEGDEDDEDVDQIDYGANEAAGANPGEKESKHQVLDKMDKKHESVMVNPK